MGKDPNAALKASYVTRRPGFTSNWEMKKEKAAPPPGRA